MKLKMDTPESQGVLITRTVTTKFPDTVEGASSKMNVMKLDFDILFGAMLCIDSMSVVSILMRTCRTLYDAGVPILLRYGVRIGSDSFCHLASFCSFMLRDPSRWPLLQTAHFFKFKTSPTERPFQHVVDDFIYILRKATRLKTLSIDRSVLKLHMEVGRAIATLQNIESFSLSGESNATRDLLRNMKSPVKKANVSFYNGRTTGNPVSFLLLLASIQVSLMDLTLTLTTWPPFAYSVRFMNVSRLTLIDCANNDLAGLIIIFPNLRELRSTFKRARETRMGGFYVADRQENLARQQQYYWYTLDYVEMPLGRLYSMAPSCPIHHLSLPYSWAAQPQFYETVLALARPSCLSLCDEFDGTLSLIFPQLLRQTPDSLRKLILEVLFDNRTSSFDSLLGCLVPMISMESCQNITHFHLKLKLDATPARPRDRKITDTDVYGTPVPSEPHPKKELNPNDATTLKEFAKGLAQVPSSLAFIAIDFCAYDKRAGQEIASYRGCWSISRSEERGALVDAALDTCSP